jgi:phosphatidylglycerol---prolipoprotein diacylglyceryl transferase
MRSYFLAHLPEAWGWILAPSYRALLTLAILLSCIWITKRATKFGLRGSWVSTAMLISAVAAFLGARALYMIEHPPESWTIWLRLYDITEGGFSLLGGAFGASLGSWLYLRLKGLPSNDLADAAAPAMGLALALARMGCFMGGCDFGTSCSLPWAVCFPPDSWAFRRHVATGLLPFNAADSLPVHPLQLYEAALGLALMAFALYWTPRRRFSGQVYLLVVLLYCLARFGLDFLRDPWMSEKWGPLLSGQVLAIIGICISLALYAHFRRSPVS